MKAWFGVLGRSCLEFLLILALVALVAGASASVSMLPVRFASLLTFARGALLDLIPLAAATALFLSLFSFERRVPSRLAGWLGAILLGCALFSGDLAARRFPVIHEIVASEAAATLDSPAHAGLQAPGLAHEQDGLFIWYRTVEGGQALDVAFLDSAQANPKLHYAARTPLDADKAELLLGDTRYSVAPPSRKAEPLAPEVDRFSDHWLWIRLPSLDAYPLFVAAVAAAGFVLLAAGFRFFARLTRWPLANAFFGSAGFLGLLILDASLASPTATSLASSLAGRAGLSDTAPALIQAAVEATLGLLLGAADLAIKTGDRSSRG